MFRFLSNALRRFRAVICLLALIIAAGGTLLAQTGPAPDPAGIATGDKSNAVDAGGSAFVVAEPTDQADSDYANKKRAFDEFQAQAVKEPLAMKLEEFITKTRRPRRSLSTIKSFVSFVKKVPASEVKAVNAMVPMRVSRATELEGLDVPEFGMLAYPEEEGIPA